MNIRLHSGKWTAAVDAFGAELKDVACGSRRYVWQGDPNIWKDSSPFLFPVVARQLNDSYLLDGKRYSMPMHGFAKDRLFSVLKTGEDHVSMALCEDAQTLEWYPFRFRLVSEFCLKENTLRITRSVTNTGKREMPFSLGEHTGYRIPAGEACALRFTRSEHAERWLLDDEIICGSEPFLDGDEIRVEPELFSRGALIFKHLRSDAVKLCFADGHGVTVGLDGWDYLGIWAKPDAPYLCIEPWNGLASSRWSPEDIWEKEGIRRLAPDSAVSFSMSIQFA